MINTIPGFNNSMKYVYLEKVDVTPDYSDENIKADAKKFILRRSRMEDKPTFSDQAKAATGALAGAVFPMIHIMKKQGLKNPLKIKYGLPEMILVSATTVIGSVLAAMPGNDSKTNRRKAEEGVFQFCNAAIPTWLAASALKLCETSRKFNNAGTKILSVAGAILVGMMGAAEVSNLICDPHDKNPDRKLTLKDTIANLDDLFGVLILAKVPFVDKLHLEKALPFIYAYCGYRAGKTN